MDGPMEQSSHTHDQTLTARDPLCSLRTVKTITASQFYFCSLVEEFMRVLQSN